MTTERWNDERLDRLADSVEANQLQIEANSRAIAELRQNLESLAQIAKLHQESLQAHDSVLNILVQEIRGLRSENRRILTHLFGEQSE